MSKKEVTPEAVVDLFGSTEISGAKLADATTVVEQPAPAVDMEALIEAMELKLLKEQADQMEIKYHPSIGVDNLRSKIAAVLVTPVAAAAEPKKADPAPVVESPMAKANRLRKESHRLIRVIVNCMNPAKQSWEGETLTVSNAVIGTVKKLVPFNLEAGYHIPYIIYQALKDRKCPVRFSVKDPRTGVPIPKMRLINEFNITVLPALTKDEIAELATQQAVGNSID